MIFESQSYELIFHDAVYSLAVGFVVGFINQVLGIFLYRGKTKLFIRDIIISVVFSVLIFSYNISFTNYNVLRWYSVAVALIGAMLFSPCFDYLGNSALQLTGILIMYNFKKLKRKISYNMTLKKEKNQKNTPKEQQDTLQQDENILYN